MSTRNPMNERYTAEEKHGVTRKSAASAKPKAKAAASVYIEPTTKTPAQKKAARKAANAKQRERDARYYNVDTPRYKQLRRIWWSLLISAVAFTLLAWIMMSRGDSGLSFVLIGFSYVAIIAALILDFTKIRKERKRYVASLSEGKTKEQRAAEKRERAEKREQEAEAAEKFEQAQKEKAEKAEKRKGFFHRSK